VGQVPFDVAGRGGSSTLGQMTAGSVGVSTGAAGEEPFAADGVEATWSRADAIISRARRVNSAAHSVISGPATALAEGRGACPLP
jgi:hypothetical protein